MSTEKSGKRGEILSPPFPDHTKLLLSSMSEMDPDWLSGLLSERERESSASS